MEEQAYSHIDSKARTVWMISGLITSVVLLGIALTVNHFARAWWIPLAVIPICFYITLVSPAFEYKQWSYRITDRIVDFSHGIFFTRRTVIPLSRIQHIDIRQGPLQKLFSIASVVIFTAGNAHEIVGLTAEKAQEVVSNIHKLIVKGDADADAGA